MQRVGDKLLSWASIIDAGTLEQARQTAAMPFVQPHLALMPDAHLGLGATVGSVIPTVGAIMPAAVGVDIGCGMNAVRTQFTRADIAGGAGDLRQLRVLHRSIARAVPLSAGRYNQRVQPTAAPRVAELEQMPGIDQAEAITPTWRLQLGSLGSGNHFIEVSLDGAENVWLFLHSGSRGIGNKLATRHIAAARNACADADLPNADLAYLTEGTAEFDTYIEALRWAQHFAALNRAEMMDRVIACLAEFVGAPVQALESVSCHHNYTTRETHFGAPVWLSRKGAIEASQGRPGLIPGSMGTRSYVVTGKGNAGSFRSAPHGAGRALPSVRAPALQPGGSRCHDGRHRVGRVRCVPGRASRGVQADRRGDAGRGRAGDGDPRVAPDRERQGRLTGI